MRGSETQTETETQRGRDRGDEAETRERGGDIDTELVELTQHARELLPTHSLTAGKPRANSRGAANDTTPEEHLP